MLNKLHDINLYAAPYVLTYGDLLQLKELHHARILLIGNKCIFTLYYTFPDKKDILKLYRFFKKENNFLNHRYCGRFLCADFLVPKNHVNSVAVLSSYKIEYISGVRIVNLLNLMNKKAPTKQLRLLFVY